MSEALLYSVLLVVCLGTWVYGNTSIRFLKLKPGEGMTIVCSTVLKDQESLYVHWSMPQTKDVFFLHKDPVKLTMAKAFQGRVETTGTFTMLNVTISSLTEYHSGFYWCEYNKFNSKTYSIDKTQGEGPVTMVHVTGPLAMEMDRNMTPGSTRTPLMKSSKTEINRAEVHWIIAGLSTSSILLVCVVILLWVTPKMKRFCKSGQFHPNPRDCVYEEMNRNRIQ